MNRKTRRNGWLMALGAAMLMAAAGAMLLPRGAQAPAPDAQASAAEERLREGSELVQTLSYTRCEHVVTRRVTAPPELYGKGLEEVAALYPEWRITEFSPALVRMERTPEMFCPDHMVLMPNGAGMLCVYRNQYGDSMALVREMDVQVKDLPHSAQEEVALGLGFSTGEEMEAWLESVES